MVVYVSNEPLKLESEGYAVNVLRTSDYLDLIANGLVTSESMIKKHPEVVRGMVAATLKGVVYVSEHPAEAFEICKKYVGHSCQSYPGRTSGTTPGAGNFHSHVRH